MKTWRAPDLPSLPGTGRVPVLHDQSSGERRVSAEGSTARMYVCGITPYDATHIGHSATYLAFDLLGRAWRDAGLSVSYVQNITDVDDPLLERAQETGEDWRTLAARQVELFSDDMASLHVIPPDHFVGATEVIPLIVSAVEELRAKGATYELEGDTYFDVTRDPRFGQVSGWTEAEMLAVYADRGGDPERPGKRNPLDCLVWLAERPGEPSWDGGALGSGRPGWHIECTAIALKYLGAGFDVQGGGSDLIFPHHEMCVSEAAVLLSSQPFARVYAYQGMVGLDGEKMSKSKGNLVFSSALRSQGVDPMAIRLAILAHHHREDWEWTADSLRTAEERLARWRSAVQRPGDGASSGTDVLDDVRRAIADDLDAPAALAVIDAWAADPSASTSPALVKDVCDALLGVRL